ncbi:MAG: tRNA-dihydrouridine synthase DusB, partial [uncultured Acidimicrobiales bacterium]
GTEHRAPRRRPARRAGTDGRRHERRLPAPVPRLRRRAVRERDGHGQRAAADERADHADGVLRPRGDPQERAALHRRPEGHRRGRPPPGGGGRRRPRRPQLRVPGGEGHEEGRRRRAPRPPTPAPGHRGGGGGRGGWCPGDREAAHRGRRPHAHAPRRRAHRRGGGRRRRAPPRQDGRAALLGCGRLAGHRRAQGGGDLRPGPRQRRHLGGGRRACDDVGHRLRRGRRRSGLPGTAVALPGPGRRLRRPSAAGAAPPGRGRRHHAGPRPPPLRPPRRALRHQGLPEARVVVPGRLPPRWRRPPPPGHGVVAGRAGGAAGGARPEPAVPGARPAPAPRAHERSPAGRPPPPLAGDGRGRHASRGRRPRRVRRL